MNYFEKILQISNQNLSKMDINQLEKELNAHYCLLSTESFDNSIIMQKIIYINFLIQEKKNNI